MHILLVEDDKNLSTIIQIALEKIGGHKVTSAADGEEALRQALEVDFDLILLDEMIPKMNGLSVCHRYNQEKKNKKAPIVFLSGKSQRKETQKFQELGTGFISKPFEISELLQHIKTILENKKNVS